MPHNQLQSLVATLASFDGNPFARHVTPDLVFLNRAGAFRVVHSNGLRRRGRAALAILRADHPDDLAVVESTGDMLYPERLGLYAVHPLPNHGHEIRAADMPGMLWVGLRASLAGVVQAIDAAAVAGFAPQAETHALFRDGPYEIRGAHACYSLHYPGDRVQLDTAIHAGRDLMRPREGMRLLLHGGTSVMLTIRDANPLRDISAPYYVKDRDYIAFDIFPQFVLADHDKRVALMAQRRDPIDVMEANPAHFYLSRMAERLAGSSRGPMQLASEDIEGVARAAVAKYGMVPFGLPPWGALAKGVADFGDRRGLDQVPADFLFMIDEEFRRQRLSPLHADAVGRFNYFPLSQDALDDFRCLHAGRDDVTVPGGIAPHHPTRDQMLWKFFDSKRAFSRGMLAAFIGADGEILQIKDRGLAEVIQLSCVNGLNFTYLRRTDALYLQFNAPLFGTRRRHWFPHGANAFLHAKEVLFKERAVADPDQPYRLVAATDFRNMVALHAGKEFARRLRGPDEPIKGARFANVPGSFQRLDPNRFMLAAS